MENQTQVLEPKKAIEKTTSPSKVACYDIPFLKPLDENLLHKIFKKYPIIFTLEDGVLFGGFGSLISEFSVRHYYTNIIEMLGLADHFPPHGTIDQLQDYEGISSEKILQKLRLYL